MRVMANFSESIEYKFQYLLSVVVICLIVRIATNLQFSKSIGPIYKILGKMAGDFFNFFLIYFMLTIMFALAGNINFLFDVK